MMEAQNAEDGLSLPALRRQYTDYVSVKTAEVEEQRVSWRYYHGAQWTEEQLRTLRARNQPEITFDRVSRKIDGLVGVVQKLRADPKAYPRTPAHEQGAELCTIVLRYALESNRWEDIEPRAVLAAAVHGIAVVELGLEQGDGPDPDVTISEVDPTTFFYDPRSVKPDFSDARYKGVSRWVGAGELDEMFPGASERVADSFGGGEWTAHDVDRAPLWVNAKKKIRLNEHWYRHAGVWRYCIYVNTVELAKGVSPFVDARGRTICRYRAWSNQVDHDGDRYGFVRRLKGPQDAINQHRSKAMHIMNTRQVVYRKGELPDVEVVRREAARPDGVIEYDGDPQNFRIEQADQEFLQQTQYFQDAKGEIENFGPNPAVLGTGVEARSGRALAMMQQSGIAELGPFLANYRAWKLDVYRSVWCAIRKWWTSERWIRVTDDEGLAQFIGVNRLQVGPMGQPVIGNALGQLDVDIILDEGPDVTNVMGDVFDILSSLAQSKIPVPPQVFVEMSALPKAVKDKVLGMMSEPPDPAQQEAAAIEIEGARAEAEKTRAETFETTMRGQKIAQEVEAGAAMMGAPLVASPPMQPEPVRPPSPEPMPPQPPAF